MLLLFVAVFILVFEHVLPLLIVRRDPQKALEILLPPFDFAARFLHPLTGTLVRLIVDGRREVPRPATATKKARETRPTAPRRERSRTSSSAKSGPCCSPSWISGTRSCANHDAASGHRRDSRRGDARRAACALPRAGVLPYSGVQGEPRQHPGRRLRQGSGALDRVGSNSQSIAGLIRPAVFVPETKRVPALLKEFQRRQVQMAIVVDDTAARRAS